MRNTVLLAIKKCFFIVLTTLMFLACNNSSSKVNSTSKIETKSVVKKTVVKSKKPVKKLVSLRNSNVVQELTKYGVENKETLILLKTSKGDMTIKLYENTPLHRANMIRLIKNDFYKGTIFYRVVNDFVIQGGDSDDWERQNIKSKMGSYTIPAEFRDNNIHKKGAIAMTRNYEKNPEKRSVSFDFFIIQGTKYTEGEIRGAEQQYDLKISAEQAEIYKAMGGCPHLDGQHTVFGEVIDGFEVIDLIAPVAVDEGDWPLEDVTIDFEILK